MMETYEVVWGRGIDDEGFTELVTERIDAETADEAVLLFPLTPDIPDGELRVYKTYTNDAGEVRRGNFIRGYEPDAYGYTWVPLTMAGPDTPDALTVTGNGSVTVSENYDVCIHQGGPYVTVTGTVPVFGIVSEDDMAPMWDDRREDK